MISLRNLNFSYAYNEAILKDINLDITDGEYVAIIGANGSGKTTLIRHFNALLLPASGDVLVDGLSTLKAKNLPEIRRRVGMIFQNPDNQIVGMTVEEDVAFGPGNLGLPSSEIKKRVDHALTVVGLSEYKTRPPHTLSGGQKQLLALAGVLAMESKFIVLDEPTASLDPQSASLVLSLLQELNQQGTAIIHVTHHMDELDNAKRIIVIDQGSIAADAPPCDIFSQVTWLKKLGLKPPKISELMWCLNQQVKIFPPGIFSVEQAGRAILSLLPANYFQGS
ncbi:MAG TPA: energy-coupling factor transporter ATPase [Syntrophomonadaceae bacterium]|nr:energy-coupling factor transporter ATPase [Syntrophomonadaceae bacterium]HPR93480.1 energy-coupling factor transporter ATPase [Syntrophomonadaceae bacterium]